MPSFADLVAQGPAQAWLFVPSAILLGALHGLEPGHSKTLMAAFIVAIRGTVRQAVLLGIAATVSHTAIVWIVALGGMYLWQGVEPERIEPYFQLASGIIIIAVAGWMAWRTYAGQQAAIAAARHSHEPGDAHDETRLVDTGHGVVELSIFEAGMPPRWRLRSVEGHAWHDQDVALTTTRPDGRQQTFVFEDRGGWLESLEEIPEPHRFEARLELGHAGHSHAHDLAFAEHDHHDHADLAGLDESDDGYRDAHERAHANDIRRRFANRNVTTWQIVVFGLTGGLIPCPAAITVLLLCIQFDEIAVGVVLVFCFSVGLAVTLIAVGIAAAVGTKHAGARFPWLTRIARKAPYMSSALIALVGLYVLHAGYAGLTGPG